MSRKTYEVRLRITVDDEKNDPPDCWSWMTLLDLSSEEDVEVLDCSASSRSDTERFVAAVEAAIADGADVRLQRDYSGRGMFGQTCPAVSGAGSEVTAALAEHGAGDLLRKCSQDSMGLGVVLYLRSATRNPER